MEHERLTQSEREEVLAILRRSDEAIKRTAALLCMMNDSMDLQTELLTVQFCRERREELRAQADRDRARLTEIKLKYGVRANG